MRSAEEQALYSTMLRKPETTDETRHSVAEHKEIDDLLNDLAATDGAAREWPEKFEHLRERYTHHIDEEEEENFPDYARLLTDEDVPLHAFSVRAAQGCRTRRGRSDAGDARRREGVGELPPLEANTDPRNGGIDDDASVEPGVWRYAMAERVRVIIDAADYFDVMQHAMLKARQRILLIGWDFDTRIHLTHGRRWWQKAWRRNFPARLGSFIPWLVNERPELEVRILKWGIGALEFVVRGSMMLDLMRWFPHHRIDFKFDTAHPVGCSHHQKIVVIDDKLAVCGGIDMTELPLGHARAPRERSAARTPGRLELRAVARRDDDDGRSRRERAGRAGTRAVAPRRRQAARAAPGDELSAWPDELRPHFENVEIGIARTRAEYEGETPCARSRAVQLQIGRAKRFIYAENQYFASRAIAEAICARLLEDDPPEIVIVNPATADGWVESTVMDPARARLVRAIQEIDRHGRFHLYTPYSGETPIYVHAKLLIVDDEILRIGSANFNNRSMGLDSECDVFIDCARPANSAAPTRIRELRHSLLAEHCGLRDEVGPALDREGSMAA